MVVRFWIIFGLLLVASEGFTVQRSFRRPFWLLLREKSIPRVSLWHHRKFLDVVLVSPLQAQGCRLLSAAVETGQDETFAEVADGMDDDEDYVLDIGQALARVKLRTAVMFLLLNLSSSTTREADQLQTKGQQFQKTLEDLDVVSQRSEQKPPAPEEKQTSQAKDDKSDVAALGANISEIPKTTESPPEPSESGAIVESKDQQESTQSIPNNQKAVPTSTTEINDQVETSTEEVIHSVDLLRLSTATKAVIGPNPDRPWSDFPSFDEIVNAYDATRADVESESNTQEIDASSPRSIENKGATESSTTTSQNESSTSTGKEEKVADGLSSSTALQYHTSTSMVDVVQELPLRKEALNPYLSTLGGGAAVGESDLPEKENRGRPNLSRLELPEPNQTVVGNQVELIETAHVSPSIAESVTKLDSSPSVVETEQEVEAEEPLLPIDDCSESGRCYSIITVCDLMEDDELVETLLTR